MNFVINHRRTIALEDQLKTQREQLKDQRESDRRRDQQQLYTTNVQHLGHSSESVKIGGIFGLERLAKESKHSDELWASRVSEILCAHIRITTTKPDYLKKDKTKPLNKRTLVLDVWPSNEIDTTLRVLTRGDDNPFDSSEFNLGWVNLQFAPMPGANLKGSILLLSNLSGALLENANLEGASLSRADLFGTVLKNAKLVGADLENTRLTIAYLKGAKLTGTSLKGAKLEGSSSGALSPSDPDYYQSRIGELANLQGCEFGDGERTDLRDISCGILTEGLRVAMGKDQDTGKTENEDRYREEHSVKRTPTQMDKERLVGKENVDKCIWGDIYMLRDEGIQEGLELG